ncbi:MAG: hypothetical protein LC808_30020, partial [Actinobacteria bacterium]|nr:hypothetical protein [Actinomycetota bacterium]
MSAGTPTIAQAKKAREDLERWIHWSAIAAALALITTAILTGSRSLSNPRLLLWVLALAILELFPIPTILGSVFSVTDPLFLALALVESPLVVLVVSFAASCDPREFRREIPLRRAIFNRSQAALAYALGSLVFHSFATPTSPWPRLLLVAIAGTAAFYVTNICVVSMGVSARSGQRFTVVARGLLLESPVESIAGYLSFGLLAAVIARLYVSSQGGGWVLVASALPLLVLARQSFLRIRQAHQESERARGNEAAFRRMAEQTRDERRDERLQLAARLHDDVIPVFESIGLMAGALKADSTDTTAKIRSAAREGLLSLRQTVAGLRASPLGEGGLTGAMSALTARYEGEQRIRLELIGDMELPPEVQLVAYQVAREGLANAVAHSKATAIQMSLSTAAGALELVLLDDGTGFDPGGVPEDHFGLRLMRERASSIGAHLQIESQRGTRIVLRWPDRTSP